MFSIILVVISLFILIGILAISLLRWWWILFFGALLLMFGIWAMFSVSIHESFEYTRKFLDAPSNYFYFFEHIEKFILWIVVCLIVYFIPRSFIRKSSYVIFWWTLILMLALFFLGEDFNKWARLWIQIAGNTIQPWEFFKVWIVFLLTSWLVRKKRIFDEVQYYIWFALITGFCAWLYFLLPDYWSLFIIWPVALTLFWFYGGKRYYILLTLIMWFAVMMFASAKSSYVKERIDYFIDPSSDENARWIWWQTTQALVSVWWWWLIGKGYGKWLQKFWYIPEAQSDFIFAAFSEEIWFLGNSVLLTLYFLLAWNVIQWLRAVRDPFDRGIVIGLISLIIIQMFVNIWVNIKLLPLTWVTLPFISHGWSALMVNMVEVILLHKIIHKIN